MFCSVVHCHGLHKAVDRFFFSISHNLSGLAKTVVQKEVDFATCAEVLECHQN